MVKGLTLMFWEKCNCFDKIYEFIAEENASNIMLSLRRVTEQWLIRI